MEEEIWPRRPLKKDQAMPPEKYSPSNNRSFRNDYIKTAKKRGIFGENCTP
jgi:hypothetical protein